MDVRIDAGEAPARDWRLEPPDWQPGGGIDWRSLRGRLLLVANVVLAARYVWWLAEPGRSAHLLLYVLLVAAEAYNLLQGLGFWWTLSRIRPVTRPGAVAVTAPAPGVPAPGAVDVLIPTYDEPVEVVEPTVAAAGRLAASTPGTEVRVAVLDDGDRPAMAELARRHGAGYFARPGSEGAKSGNVNWALERTDAPYVAVLDCDHVPDVELLTTCLAAFDDAGVAFVQTPQYYANWRDGGVAEASWSQQSLFFGTIARGRDAEGAMFCCGTNVVFRRDALDAVGGFSLDSLTEDFELSIRLHERGWQSRYVPRVLASGLGPEDMGSYVSQQLRWARGCLSSLPQVLRARLPLRLRLQYLQSAAYWLTGWTLIVYMAFPVVRILTGVQPIEVASPEEFLVHWGPYFVASMITVGLAGAGRYTFAAFALMTTSFWIHIVASLLTALRRKGTFAVTPKQGQAGVQVRPVLVPLLVALGLVGVGVYGLVRDRSPATVTNASFALVHIVVLAGGIRFALEAGRPMTRTWLGAVLLVAALVVAGLVGACGGDDDGSGDDGPSADDGLAASPATARFLADHVTPEGRVVRHDEGGDTVSEGQAYALLFAAGTGDEAQFEQVWAWTQDNLQRDDGPFAWRWDGGAVVDDQPAADADLDVVAALLLAAERFERPEWRDEAQRVADAVMAHETFEVDGRLLLAAGPWAVDSQVVNPSYLARCDYDELAELTGDDAWDRLGADGLDVVASLVDDGLPPDWARVAPTGELDAVAGADATEGPGRYGLDAARIPVRLASCDEGTEIAAALWPRLRDTDGEGAALAYGPDGERLDDAEHPLGLVGAAAAAVAAGDEDQARRLLSAAQDRDRATPTYYGAAWVAFGEALLADDAALAAPAFEAQPVSAVGAGQEPTTTSTPATSDTTGTTVTTSTPSTTAAPGTPTTDPGGTTPTTDGTGTIDDTTDTTDTTTATGEAPAVPGEDDGSTSTTTPAGPGDSPGGDLSGQEPGAAEQLPGRGAPDEPAPVERARRTTGALALGGLAAAVTLGAVLGLRERRAALAASPHTS